MICRVIPGTHSSFYSKEFRPVYRKIVQPVVEPMDRFAALIINLLN